MTTTTATVLDEDEGTTAAGIPRPRDADGGTLEPEAPDAYDLTRGGRHYRIPKPYDVRADGVWVVKWGKDENDKPVEVARARIATAPILPTQILYAPDGVELLEVTWWHAKQGRPVSEVVPRAIASVGRALVKALHPKGFPVVDSDGPRIEKYLAETEAENTRSIPTAPVARQLGWQPDGAFVAGPGVPRRVVPSYPNEQRGALEAHHCRGTLADWRAAIAHAAPYSTPRAAIAACLGTPLLELLAVPPFLLDLHSTSSGGKTTSGQAGFSAWGNPALGAGGGIAQWSATRTAIQLRLALCNGLPVVLDESKNVRHEEIVKNIIYDLPNGEPGGRSGDYYSAPIAWSVIVVSTGERSVLTFTADAGAAARVLSPSAGAPFGRDGEKSAAAARAVTDGVAQHYGHAGPAFIELLADAGRREWIVKRHTELAAVHRVGSDIARRRAPYVALLQATEEAACKASILPYKPMPTEQWAALLGGDQTTDDPAERALEVVRSLVVRNPHRMCGEIQPDAGPAGGWIGSRRAFDGRSVVCLLAEPLREELTRQGIELDAVKPFWIERGWLTMDPAKPKYLVRRYPIKGGPQARVYEFTVAVFNGD